MTLINEPDVRPLFSEMIRAASWDKHEAAADSPYMRRLLGGELDRPGYGELVAQHRFVYAVLEDAASVMAHDPIAGGFVSSALTRLPAIDADLAVLLGDDWRDRILPSPATEAYCNRLAEVCYTWPGGFVAHHYTRYMGDLSGGAIMRRVLHRVYDLPDDDGIRFFVFDRISDPKAFKAGYRDRLDRAPWPESERALIVEEILRAYELNLRVFTDLG